MPILASDPGDKKALLHEFDLGPGRGQQEALPGELILFGGVRGTAARWAEDLRLALRITLPCSVNFPQLLVAFGVAGPVGRDSPQDLLGGTILQNDRVGRSDLRHRKDLSVLPVLRLERPGSGCLRSLAGFSPPAWRTTVFRVRRGRRRSVGSR